MEHFKPSETLSRINIIDILRDQDSIDPFIQAKIDEYANNTGLEDTALKFHMVDIYVESGHISEAIQLLETLQTEHPELEQKVKEIRYGIEDRVR